MLHTNTKGNSSGNIHHLSFLIPAPLGRRNCFLILTILDLEQNKYGVMLICALKDLLQPDEVSVHGPFFSRMPGVRDSDGYFYVQPVLYQTEKQYSASVEVPYYHYILDEFTKVKDSEVPDKLNLPIDFRLVSSNSNAYFADQVEIICNGEKSLLEKRLKFGELPYLEFTYKL